MCTFRGVWSIMYIHYSTVHFNVTVSLPAMLDTLLLRVWHSECRKVQKCTVRGIWNRLRVWRIVWSSNHSSEWYVWYITSKTAYWCVSWAKNFHPRKRALECSEFRAKGRKVTLLLGWKYSKWTFIDAPCSWGWSTKRSIGCGITWKSNWIGYHRYYLSKF